MNSEIKSIKNKLKGIIKNKEVLDVILFGSAIKGKSVPKDIDIAIISEKNLNSNLFNLETFHFSFLKTIDFFKKRVVLLNILFREGYSLKFNKPFSEMYGFKSRILFIYELKNLKNSNKVKIVNLLRGKKNQKGMVFEKGGNWLANQIFTIPINKEYVFEKFFVHFGIKFKKYYLLMH